MLIARDDRFFPSAFQYRLAAERLSLQPDEFDGGHMPMIVRPIELARRLSSYA